MRRLLGTFFLLALLAIPVFAEDVPTFRSSEYVVSASKLPQSRFENPWSVTVLTSEEIKALGAANLADAVRFAAGVDVKSTGQIGAQSSIKLRGSSYQQVLVLLDGARLNSPLLGGAQIEDILLEDVDRIEVVRAPVSSVYGADAVGGVINVITKKDAANNISFKSGTYLDGDLSLSIGKLPFFKRSYLNLNGIKDRGFRQNSDYQATNGLLAVGWDDLVGSWDVTLGQYSASKGLPGVPSVEADPYSSSTPGDREKDWRTFADVGLKHSFGDKNSLNVRAYENILNQETHIFDFWGGSFADTSYYSWEKMIEASHGFSILNQSLSYGGDYRESYGRSDYAGMHTINNIGVFLEDQVTFGRQLYLTLGVRGDRHSVIGDNVSPRVGLVYSPWRDLFIKTSLSYAYRAPTLNDLYWNDPIWQMYGNANLRSEKIRSGEICLERRLGSGSYASVTYYDSAITDLILWNFDPLTYITQAENLGTSSVTGVEFEYVQKLSDAMSGFLNYTYQKAKNTTNNADTWLPYAPESKGNVGVTYNNSGYTSSLKARFVGSRYTDTANTVSQMLPAYTVADLSLSKKWGGVDLSLYVDNVFDQVYYESIGYLPVTYAVRKYPMPGRVIKAELGFSF
ncbi:MAG: TonB-dependent receptor [Candidatus Saganbacteria bacterium]|nr:TonB-dependent receptor [Candidatus Saganbacteria bacterium]